MQDTIQRKAKSSVTSKMMHHVAQLQRTLGNQATIQFLSNNNQPQPQMKNSSIHASIETENENNHSGKSMSEVIQRLTASITVKEDVITAAKVEGSRPATNIAGGHQGEHTTAFVTFKHMAINNVKGKTLDVAKSNLLITLEELKELPGYEDAPKFLIDSLNDTISAADGMEANKENIQQIMVWAIELRNSIPMSANKKISTGGHGEGGQAGGLQTLEQKVRKGTIASQDDVDGNPMVNVWELYDFNAIDAQSAEKWSKLLVQHMLSIQASYPHIFEIIGIYSTDDMKAHLYTEVLSDGDFETEIKSEIDKMI